MKSFSTRLGPHRETYGKVLDLTERLRTKQEVTRKTPREEGNEAALNALFAEILANAKRLRQSEITERLVKVLFRDLNRTPPQV